MNVIGKLTLRTLKRNPKRTAVTVVGVVMAAALITAVANLAVSFRASMVKSEQARNGGYHYCFQGVKEEDLGFFANNRNIRRLGIQRPVGYALFSESRNPDKPYFYVTGMDGEAMDLSGITLKEGRLPEKEGEAAVSLHINTNGGGRIRVGDVLTLALGERESLEGESLDQEDAYLYDGERFAARETREYTVVGILERPAYRVEGRMAPGYTVLTWQEQKAETGLVSRNTGPVSQTEPGADVRSVSQVEPDPDASLLNLYVTYPDSVLKKKEEATAGLMGIPRELFEKVFLRGEPESSLSREEQELLERRRAQDVTSHSALLKWVLLDFSNGTMNVVYALGGIAIGVILVTAVFCIRNSFVISLTEKMRLYGMLSSVGATGKQRRGMVYREALWLGLLGIPLGLVCGTAATFLLVKATGKMLLVGAGVELIYAASLPAMGVGALLSAVTLFLSAALPARRAGRVSPIQAIRGNEAVRIRKRQLRTPGYVHRLFGIGGVVAFKNLRRARVKYRTTVVSIVLSVAVFIAMTTFTRLVFREAVGDRERQNFSLRVYLAGDAGEQGEAYEAAKEIAGLEEVEYAELRRGNFESFQVPWESLRYSPECLEDHPEFPAFFREHHQYMTLFSLGEEGYERYCRSLGLDPGQVSDKGILVGSYRLDERAQKERGAFRGRILDYEAGDVITGAFVTGEGEQEAELSLEVAANVLEYPLCLEAYVGEVYWIVSDSWMDEHAPASNVLCYIQCRDPDALEETLYEREPALVSNVENYDQEYRASLSFYLMLEIFLYGFITVVALIGVTNIFNTVTTNMELRAREFAMLRSVGMTKGEFRRMIGLESLFYGGKALLIGIPLGVGLSCLFCLVIGEKPVFPGLGILISSLAVGVLLWVIMRYSLKRINRRGLMETIQNENI